MFILTDLFFWAFFGMFGLLVGIAMVSGTEMGKNAALGVATIIVCDLIRIILVLPFCSQPCFDIGIWNWIGGGIFLAIALVFGVPAMSINWWTAPDNKMIHKTNLVIFH